MEYATQSVGQEDVLVITARDLEPGASRMGSAKVTQLSDHAGHGLDGDVIVSAAGGKSQGLGEGSLALTQPSCSGTHL